jgi:hypothetical protein
MCGYDDLLRLVDPGGKLTTGTWSHPATYISDIRFVNHKQKMTSTGNAEDVRDFFEKFEPCFIARSDEQSIREPDENNIQRHILDCMGAPINLKRKKSTWYCLESRIFFAAVSSMATSAIKGENLGTSAKDKQGEGNALIIRNFPPPDFSSAPKGIKKGRSALSLIAQQKASHWLCMHWIACIGQILTLTSDDHRALIEADPMSIQSIDGQTFKATPAHYTAAAADSEETVSFMSLMAEACPRIAFTKGHDGWLPLHYAAKYSNSVEMLELLLQLNPSASSTATSSGDFPIHVLSRRTDMRDDLKVAMMKCLLEADPHSATALNGKGDTILHLLCATVCSCGDDVVRLCLKVAPQLASLKDQYDRLPLNVFTNCDHNDDKSAAIMKLILEAYKEGAVMTQVGGFLPLHCAA